MKFINEYHGNRSRWAAAYGEAATSAEKMSHQGADHSAFLFFIGSAGGFNGAA